MTKEEWDAMQRVQRDDAVTTHHLRNLFQGGGLMQPDGAVSTVRTAQVDGLQKDSSGNWMQGQPTLIPTIWDGQQLSTEDAQQRAFLQQQFGGVQWPTADTHPALREQDVQLHQNFDGDIQTATQPEYFNAREEILRMLRQGSK
tara:strand:+ start:8868 stop:9299 length:432 start_codon:yes stop_codon:yes gene_type:complete